MTDDKITDLLNRFEKLEQKIDRQSKGLDTWTNDINSVLKKYEENISSNFKEINNLHINTHKNEKDIANLINDNDELWNKVETEVINEDKPLILSLKIDVADGSLLFYIKNLKETNIERNEIGYIEPCGDSHIISNNDWVENYETWFNSKNTSFSNETIEWNNKMYLIDNYKFCVILNDVITPIYDFLEQKSFSVADDNLTRFKNEKFIFF